MIDILGVEPELAKKILKKIKHACILLYHYYKLEESVKKVLNIEEEFVEDDDCIYDCDSENMCKIVVDI